MDDSEHRPNWRALRLSDYESAQRLYERTIGVFERIALLLVSAHAVGVGVVVNAIISGGFDANGAARDLMGYFIGGVALAGGAVMCNAFMAQTRSIALMRHIRAEFDGEERRPFRAPFWGFIVGLLAVAGLVGSAACLMMAADVFLEGYPEAF